MKKIFKSCWALIEDKDVIAELSALVEEPQLYVQPERRFNLIGKILKTGHELRMNYHIGYYDTCYIILGLGSDVNNITKKTWKIWGSRD